MFGYVMPFLFLKYYSEAIRKKDTQQDPFVRVYLMDTHEKLLADKSQPINQTEPRINHSELQATATAFKLVKAIAHKCLRPQGQGGTQPGLGRHQACTPENVHRRRKSGTEHFCVCKELPTRTAASGNRGGCACQSLI